MTGDNKEMNVSIFGLGYVGIITGCCLAKWGHHVIGVDINRLKVESINKCESPIIEPGISELLREVVENKKFIATVDASEAIMNSDLSLICVGTPSNHNGSLNLTYIYNVAEQIGRALSKKSQYHIVIVRSTVLPGTIEKVASIIEELSGKILGKDFSIASNPEFLREGTSIQDFEQPPYTIVGTSDDRVIAALHELYAPTNAPIYCLNIGEAELLKYFSNIFHALKIVFANEAGSICKKYGIDSHNVINIFLQDTNLNISAAYLKPGFAFGGSCLPKDLRALTYESRNLDLRLPLFESLLMSNDIHIQRVIDWVIFKNKKKIGILGLSFKSNTDDMRESPIVKVVETLLGKGYEISIYDPNVNLSKLIGANKQYIEEVIPHISRLMKQNIHEVVDEAELIVVANKNKEFAEAVLKLRTNQIVLDLVRIPGDRMIRRNYEGICW
jgi:GDP-mannose 6-dehydrogenase